MPFSHFDLVPRSVKPIDTNRYLDDAEIKSHLKYTKDWDQAERFVKTKKTTA